MINNLKGANSRPAVCSTNPNPEGGPSAGGPLGAELRWRELIADCLLLIV